jgi:hypothetical protein
MNGNVIKIGKQEAGKSPVITVFTRNGTIYRVLIQGCPYQHF